LVSFPAAEAGAGRSAQIVVQCSSRELRQSIEFDSNRDAQVTIDLRLTDMHLYRFSPDLLHRVRDSIERGGICIFGVDEMERLLSEVKGSLASKAKALQEFARLCGVEVETTPHLKSAVFVKSLGERHERRNPSD
jgi:hypothetical protein